ncbi:MAG: pirin family protein [Deltaproteobacteria bacterium]|nr:MAG: pirin family protein [Deltaproteobacteria bacterium]
MSWTQCPDPRPGDATAVDAIETIIVPRSRDLGGFEVRRVLPVAGRRMVGPFIFFDQMGPAAFEIGAGLDVRPHPHINLATLTYLFDGEIYHRDSVGSALAIRPGAVNLMTAGRGIVHSERSSPEARQEGARVFGLQTWVALPEAHEETEPAFAHHEAEALPSLDDGTSFARLVAGQAWGQRSPVRTFGDVLYADILLRPGGSAPIEDTSDERALYIVSGTLEVDGASFDSGRMLVLRPGTTVRIRNRTEVPCRVVLVGGDAPDGPRHIWWNFVSSRPERIEQAKEEWRSGRFDTVPGDVEEFIPLPEDP